MMAKVFLAFFTVLLILTIYGPLAFAPSSAQDVAPGLPLSGEMMMTATEIRPSVEISVEEIGDSLWKLFPSYEN